MIITLKRSLKSAWINFTRNLGLSLVAVFTIAITLLFLTFALIAKDFGEDVSTDVKDKISVSVYFKDGVDEETVLMVREDLLELDYVKSIDYTSKQKALENFISRHSDNAVLMAALAEVGNPFQSSLSIISDSHEGYEMVVAALDRSPSNLFFEKVDYDQRKTIIEGVFNIAETIGKVGLVLAVVMAVTSVLIVFNVIRMAICSMREEVSVMRLVGVSRNYLVSSFVFQGIITGIAGITASLITLAATVLVFGERITTLVPGLNLDGYLLFEIKPLIIIHFGVAIFLAVASSLIAVVKYLKV